MLNLTGVIQDIVNNSVKQDANSLIESWQLFAEMLGENINNGYPIQEAERLLESVKCISQYALTLSYSDSGKAELMAGGA